MVETVRWSVDRVSGLLEARGYRATWTRQPPVRREVLPVDLEDVQGGSDHVLGDKPAPPRTERPPRAF
jgi:hypothetical protein